MNSARSRYPYTGRSFLEGFEPTLKNLLQMGALLYCVG